MSLKHQMNFTVLKYSVKKFLNTNEIKIVDFNSFH